MTASILHICRDDEKGGAARCAHRLHVGLGRIGTDSRMLVQRRQGTDPLVEQYRPPTGQAQRLRRAFRRRVIRRDFDRYRASRPAKAEAFNDDRSQFGADPARWVRPNDVVHLHWASGFIDLERFLAGIPDDVPVVWTLHDMNLFTGGCHYAGGCERFSEECGACPQLGSEQERDLSRAIWRRKQAALSRLEPSRLRIVTPSRWLAQQARSSAILAGRFSVDVIPYGLDTEAYAPRDKDAARQTLGIPPQATVVLFVADSIGNRRKGLHHLREALTALVDIPGLFVLSIGKGEPDISANIPGLHLATSDDRLLSLVYSAADVLVVPSLEDNLPATVLEALACGTPVAGFEVGGIPDMVRPGETGNLAMPGDAADLARAIRHVVEDPARHDTMVRRARKVAVTEYGLEVQARRYADIYADLSARAAGEGV